MKIWISNYRNHWISPYTILKKVCFWEKDDDVFYDLEDTGKGRYVKIVNFLAPICEGLQKLLNFIHPRIEYVKIDQWDTWSMDHVLAPIILPMLKQIKETKHGAPHVDDADVPEYLRSHMAQPKENEWDTDSLWFMRWDWVLDEMIFAFEHLIDDSWQETFRSGEVDMISVPCKWDENGKPILYSFEEGPSHSYKLDYEGMKVVEERMQKGFELFGKYYRNLWT